VKVPMTDLRAQQADLREEIEAGFRRVLETGRFILGDNVHAFEEAVAAYLDVPYAVTCASGTDALHLALRALGIAAGDEVITTAFTFVAVAEAIRHAGATPVFVDIDETTFNLDPELVEQAVTPATRAILAVHLFGQPAAMEKLLAVARRHDLWLVEDCAQAFGAARGESAVGSLGDAGCFSFYPSKNLGAYGDGGMITTRLPELAVRLRRLRNHGVDESGIHLDLGLNSRLDELQAVVLCAKLERVEAYNAARRRVAERYNANLATVAEVQTPAEEAGGRHVYNQYTVLVANRDAVRSGLEKRGIATAVHYARPLHWEPALAEAHHAARLPVAEAVAARCLSLPLYPELSDLEIDYVTESLRDVIARP